MYLWFPASLYMCSFTQILLSIFQYSRIAGGTAYSEVKDFFIMNILV
jgi:hypothetical protein